MRIICLQYVMNLAFDGRGEARSEAAHNPADAGVKIRPKS
jgi:hypothetical protein